jgi:hypothetical protein
MPSVTSTNAIGYLVEECERRVYKVGPLDLRCCSAIVNCIGPDNLSIISWGVFLDDASVNCDHHAILERAHST